MTHPLAQLIGVCLALLVSACGTLPPGHNLPRQVSVALPPAAGDIGVAAAEQSAHPGKSAFRMIGAGLDGLAMRLESIDAARRTLDLQYYIFRADESGCLVARALLRAAERGVRIRILVDDGESVAGDERLFALAAQPGIEIRVFNPFDYRGHIEAFRAIDFIVNKGRLDYRMHNKLLVVDNSLALIGGRNIGDQYFQIDPKSQFGDDDAAVMGSLVGRLSGVFDQFWNAPVSIPIQAIDKKHSAAKALARFRIFLRQQREPSSLEKDLSARMTTRQPLADITENPADINWAGAELVFDSPDKHDVVDGVAGGRLIATAVQARMSEVNLELLMITPYLVPSPREDELLERLRARNVGVRMLTNSLEAAPNVAAHSGYAKDRPKFLGEGIELHEIRARVESTQGTGQSRAISRFGNYGLHAKIYVFDRRSVFVGSMNFDQRSERLNTEIGLIIDSPAIAAAAGRRFDELTQLTEAYSVQLSSSNQPHAERLVWRSEDNGVVVAQYTEPGRGAWQRFKARFLSWLPLDGEL